MVVTDLDGTLLRDDRTVSARDDATLRALGERGVTRVIATGRSLYSARLVLPPSFPIDYLVFSTGVGVVDWPVQRIVRTETMSVADVNVAVRALRGLGLHFMLHEPAPENHRFAFWRGTRGRGDFEARLTRYVLHARDLPEGDAPDRPMSQLVAIADAGDVDAHRDVVDALPGFEVIRTTSPLDGRSRWIEVFPKGVSKSAAARWIAERHGVGADGTLAIGNDYNDTDLLRWGTAAFVVANAPEELRRAHPVVSTNDKNGFSEAVERWLLRPALPGGVDLASG